MYTYNVFIWKGHAIRHENLKDQYLHFRRQLYNDISMANDINLKSDKLCKRQLKKKKKNAI